MRTKTLLLTAALCAVGVVTSVAQAPVYSVNAVGYVNKTISAGYNLIANPLNASNNVNLLSAVIPVAPDGTSAQKWDGVNQQFAQADTFLGGGWINGAFEPSTTVVRPGEGFFIQYNSGANAVLTFVGEVPQGPLTNSIGAQNGFYSSIVPQSATLTALGFPGVEGMAYLAWDKVNQQYAQALNYLGGGWINGNFDPAEPTPAVAEGFLIVNPGPLVQWGRTFSVNN